MHLGDICNVNGEFINSNNKSLGMLETCLQVAFAVPADLFKLSHFCSSSYNRTQVTRLGLSWRETILSHLRGWSVLEEEIDY